MSANWHWKSKDVSPWAKEWLERELPTLNVTGDDGVSVTIDQAQVDGDCEIGQRKSKLIAIYDVKVDIKWSGVASDGTAVQGQLLVPEVSHEITLDQLSDYVFNWTLTTASSKSVEELFALAKKRLPVALQAKFAEFPVVMLDTHGRDIQVTAASSAEPSRVSTPAPAVPSPTPAANVAQVKKTAPGKIVNTSAVTVETSFMASADDLFGLLTDETRIPAWSRAPAQSKVEEGGHFSLFGGGVKGTFVSLSRPSQFVQKWSLENPRWPSGHFATLTVTLEQQTDSTTVKLFLNGVPKGLEEELEGNLNGYYIRGLKSIGYVQLFPSPPSRHHASPSPSPRVVAQVGRQRVAYTLLVSALALIAAFAIPYLNSATRTSP